MFVFFVVSDIHNPFRGLVVPFSSLSSLRRSSSPFSTERVVPTGPVRATRSDYTSTREGTPVFASPFPRVIFGEVSLTVRVTQIRVAGVSKQWTMHSTFSETVYGDERSRYGDSVGRVGGFRIGSCLMVLGGLFGAVLNYSFLLYGGSHPPSLTELRRFLCGFTRPSVRGSQGMGESECSGSSHFVRSGP